MTTRLAAFACLLFASSSAAQPRPEPKGDRFCRAGIVRQNEPVVCDGMGSEYCAAELLRMERACYDAYMRARAQWKLAAQGKAPVPVAELEGILDNAIALRDATYRRPDYHYSLSVGDVESDLSAARMMSYKTAPLPPASYEIHSDALRPLALGASPSPEPTPVKRWRPLGWIAGILALFAASSALFFRGRKEEAAIPAAPVAPPTPGALPSPGELVAERYLVKEELRGAADPGWAAVDRLTGDAIILRGPGHGAALEEEARRASTISHPGAVRVRGSVRDPRGLFVISDRIEGDTLAAKCAAHGPFDLDFVKRIVAQACGTLSAVHGLGLAHGGICAERLVLDQAAALKIVGFGPMRSSVGAEAAPPEATASPSGDLYALACTAYLLMFKAQPFTGSNLAARKASGDFVSATNRRPGLPLALDLFFTRALSPDPARRFAYADEFRAEFERALP